MTVDGGAYTYNNVKQWTGSGVAGKSNYINIFATSHVVVPINIVSNHWLVAIIFPQLRSIAIYDSLEGSYRAHNDRVYKLLLQYIKDEHLDKLKTPLPNTSEWHRVYPACTLQPNGNDCGVCSLANTDHVLLGELPAYAPVQLSTIRRYILLTCLKGTLELPQA